ncbi:porin [Mesorhizobium sp. WSM4962]|uniref:porin n=1 Tax=Mesorhizobium sp. WSM4962 TaxID=3038548 RepID=UPI003FA58AD9
MPATPSTPWPRLLQAVGGNWAVWGGGTYKFNDKTAFNLQASADDDKNYALAANVAYTIVPGYTIKPKSTGTTSAISTTALRSATGPRPTRRTASAASSASSAISDRKLRPKQKGPRHRHGPFCF